MRATLLLGIVALLLPLAVHAGYVPFPYTVPVGGTDAITLTAHGPLLSNSPIAAMAAGSSGQVGFGQSAADPLWETISGAFALASTGQFTLANGGPNATESLPSEISLFASGLANTTVQTGQIALLGDGSDSSFSSSGSTAAPAWATKASAVYTMTRDANLTNLTLIGTAQIKTSGFRLFINGTLDITAAAASAIECTGTVGGNGVAGGAAGSGGALIANATVGGGLAGQGGGAGGASSGSAGTGTGNQAIASAGGVGGAGSNGGNSGASGGAQGTTGASWFGYATRDMLRGASLVTSGYGGGGGGGGIGNGVTSGAGGAGGGGAACMVWLSASIISTGGSTVASTITAIGGLGGTGGLGGAAEGGGGAGGGGGGGYIYLLYGTKSGSPVSNLVDASGGTGGVGGGSGLSGDAAAGGQGGNSGGITIINLTTNSSTQVLANANAGGGGNAASGTTGGTGGTGGSAKANL